MKRLARRGAALAAALAETGLRWLPRSRSGVGRQFDATLGYPGEGPLTLRQLKRQLWRHMGRIARRLWAIRVRIFKLLPDLNRTAFALQSASDFLMMQEFERRYEREKLIPMFGEVLFWRQRLTRMALDQHHHPAWEHVFRWGGTAALREAEFLYNESVRDFLNRPHNEIRVAAERRDHASNAAELVAAQLRALIWEARNLRAMRAGRPPRPARRRFFPMPGNRRWQLLLVLCCCDTGLRLEAKKFDHTLGYPGEGCRSRGAELAAALAERSWLERVNIDANGEVVDLEYNSRLEHRMSSTVTVITHRKDLRAGEEFVLEVDPPAKREAVGKAFRWDGLNRNREN